MLKRLSSVLSVSLLLGIIFISVVYSACKKEKYAPSPDNCADIVCHNNGTCIDGKCKCTIGYTGDNCEKKAILPYIGKWNVTQQIVGSYNQDNIGKVKTYEVIISEHSDGVTLMNISGFLGEASYNALARVGLMIGYIDIDSTKTETDIQANSSHFVFKRYHPLGSSVIQVVKGEGIINNVGTYMSGEFYIVYPDSAKGAIQDRITFGATLIN